MSMSLKNRMLTYRKKDPNVIKNNNLVNSDAKKEVRRRLDPIETKLDDENEPSSIISTAVFLSCSTCW
jgi:hypothetical protein